MLKYAGSGTNPQQKIDDILQNGISREELMENVLNDEATLKQAGITPEEAAAAKAGGAGAAGGAAGQPGAAGGAAAPAAGGLAGIWNKVKTMFGALPTWGKIAIGAGLGLGILGPIMSMSGKGGMGGMMSMLGMLGIGGGILSAFMGKGG